MLRGMSDNPPTSSAPVPGPGDASGRGPRLHGPGKKKPSDASALYDPARALPSAVDMERCVISCMMQAPDYAVGLAMEKLTPEHFSVEAHTLLFDMVVRQFDGGKPVDPVSLTQILHDRDLIGKVGGPAFVSEVYTASPNPAHVAHYADQVQQKAILRNIIKACSDCIGRAFDDQENVGPLLDEVEARILGIRESEESKKGTLTMKERVFKAIDDLEKLAANPNAINGLPTGLKKLDEMTGGMHAGEMIIIAARPSMGKTSLAMNVIEHVAVDQKKACAVFSLEMTADSLVQRLICARARINMRSLMSGQFLNKGDFQQMTRAASQLAGSNIIIDDTPALSILDLRSKARRFKKLYGIELIAVDYLQLCRSTSKRAADNRQQEIAEISSGLKALAKELSIPVIVLAQLNRGPETRGSGKPKLSDLRESGSIEQDADVVGLLYRPEYYAEDEEEKQEVGGQAELIIAKQRNGPTGAVPLTFLKEFMRFETRDGEVGEIE
jgi:replicative DNA helicase